VRIIDEPLTHLRLELLERVRLGPIPHAGLAFAGQPRTVLRSWPTWRAMAEIVHPRLLNDVISTSSSGVSIEAGLLLHAGRVLVDHQRWKEPHPYRWMHRGAQFQ
jgi:hypothetical protein